MCRCILLNILTGVGKLQLSFFLLTTFLASWLHSGGNNVQQQEKHNIICAVPASTYSLWIVFIWGFITHHNIRLCSLAKGSNMTKHTRWGKKASDVKISQIKTEIFLQKGTIIIFKPSQASYISLKMAQR